MPLLNTCLEIIEIKRRLDINAGVTEPFVCQCSDGNEYYVKGKYAGYQEMIRELVSAEIASRLSLPVPAFAVAWLPDNWRQQGKSITTDAIGYGPVFASRAVPRAMRYQDKMSGKHKLKHNGGFDETARQIALFDWWIRNPDRSAGNPNMLISRGQLFIIDHNMAFTGNETLGEFKRLHVFGDMLALALTKERKNAEQKFDCILEAWNDIRSMIPCQWIESCLDGEAEVKAMRKTLERHRVAPDSFWDIRGEA